MSGTHTHKGYIDKSYVRFSAGQGGGRLSSSVLQSNHFTYKVLFETH